MNGPSDESGSDECRNREAAQGEYSVDGPDSAEIKAGLFPIDGLSNHMFGYAEDTQTLGLCQAHDDKVRQWMQRESGACESYSA